MNPSSKNLPDKIPEKIISWLLAGDVSIQYQTHKYLLAQDKPDLQERIAIEGWGRQFLSKRKPQGHWGKRFYEPKWISSHYTLLDLRNLEIKSDHPLILESINQIIHNEKGPDGGIYPIGEVQKCDVCVNGMFLNYACYFGTATSDLVSIIDFLLTEKMSDGGFNCRSNGTGAIHSSLHSTTSVLEGFIEYLRHNHSHRRKEVKEAIKSSTEFILIHRLFRSDKTGAIIHPDFLKLRYPCRWKYDILRALDCFRAGGIDQDGRMQEALDILISRRKKDHTWNLNAKHPGKLHFEMEKAGQPSRWNTLRALRVLKHFYLN